MEPLAYWHRGTDEWIGWLAESWDKSEDGMTFTINLREGIEWSDGSDFTSKDILATWYCGRLIQWPQWAYIDSVVAEDDYTVVFNLAKTWIFTEYEVLRTLTSPYSVYGNFSDDAQVAYEAGDTDTITELSAELTAFRPPESIGTGPFEFVELTSSEMLFEKRDTYWYGIDKIKYDYYLQIHLGSGPSEFAGILNHDFDLSSPDLTRQVYDMILALGDIYVPTYSWYHGQSLIFNMHRYPLSIKEVRQAFAYALNRTEFCIAISPHEKFALPTIYPSGLLYDAHEEWVRDDFIDNFNEYPYNLTKATELLEGLGFSKGTDGIWVTPNGTKFEFDISSPPWTDWALGCENIKSQYAKFGITINVYATEPVVCVDIPASDFDLGLHCFLRNFGNLPVPYNSFQDRTYGSATWSAGVGTYNKLFEVPGQNSLDEDYGMVNATEYSRSILAVADKEGQIDLIQALAYIDNHYLPHIGLREKPSTWTFNMKDTKFPDPDTNQDYYEWSSMALERATAYYIMNGLIEPTVIPEPEPEPEPEPQEVIPTYVYGVVGVAVIAIIAAVVISVRKRP
jgi:peptide/nickel transport system substrate-binding protein